MKMVISEFDNKFDNIPKQKEIAWDDLRGELLRFRERLQQEGKLWSPCRYLPDGKRTDVDVTEMWAFVLDFDDGAVPEDLEPYWKELGLEYLIHSTWHNNIPKHDKPAAVRWRAIFPFERPCTGGQWADVFPRTAKHLAGDTWDQSCSDCCRMFYYPCISSGREGFSRYQDGRKLKHGEAPALPAVKKSNGKTTTHVDDGEGWPASDYCEKGDHARLLTDHGWTHTGDRGQNETWTRPGKTKGTSGTWHKDRHIFYCFTSSTELNPRKGYNLFQLLAEMEHGGDYSECAKRLYKDGYGDRLDVKGKTEQQPDGDEEPVILYDSRTDPRGPKPNEVDPVDFKWDPPARFNESLVTEFPIDSLPAWMGDFVMEVAESTQTPVDLGAMVALSVLSSAARGRFNIEAPAGHEEPLTLYSLVALPPGERKSSVFSILKAPLDDWEAELSETTAPEIGAEQMRQGVIEKRLEALKNKAAKASDPMERNCLMDEAADLAREVASFEPCEAPRLMADDVTPEELVHLLAAQRGNLSLLSAEGGLFDIIAGLYSDGRSNIDALLKSYDGESIRVDRRSRAPLHIKRAVLTLGLAVQPAVIQGLAQNKKFRGRGLIGRFAFSLPESMVGNRIGTHPISSMSRSRYNAKVGDLLDLDCEPVCTIKCSPEALGAFNEYSAAIEPRLSPVTGDLGTMTDWAGKLCGRLARIAGLIQLAEHGESTVSQDTMQRALGLGDYFISHANAIFSLMGADPMVESAKKVLGWVERNISDDEFATFSERDCFNGMQKHFKRVAKLNPVLALLENHGYIMRLPRKKKNGPGRISSPAYMVNPLWK